MKKSELRKMIKEEIIKEASRNDIKFALRDITEFNRNNIDLKTMSMRVVKSLGFKTNTENVKNAMDHLSNSVGSNDLIPIDTDVVLELYRILR